MKNNQTKEIICKKCKNPMLPILNQEKGIVIEYICSYCSNIIEIEKIELKINIETRIFLEKLNEERFSIELVKKGITKGYKQLSNEEMEIVIPFTRQFDKHLTTIINLKDRFSLKQEYKQPNEYMDLLYKIFDIIEEMEAQVK